MFPNCFVFLKYWLLLATDNKQEIMFLEGNNIFLQDPSAKFKRILGDRLEIIYCSCSKDMERPPDYHKKDENFDKLIKTLLRTYYFIEAYSRWCKLSEVLLFSILLIPFFISCSFLAMLSYCVANDCKLYQYVQKVVFTFVRYKSDRNRYVLQNSRVT